MKSSGLRELSSHQHQVDLERPQPPVSRIFDDGGPTLVNELALDLANNVGSAALREGAGNATFALSQVALGRQSRGIT